MLTVQPKYVHITIVAANTVGVTLKISDNARGPLYAKIEYPVTAGDINPGNVAAAINKAMEQDAVIQFDIPALSAAVIALIPKIETAQRLMAGN